MAPAFLRWPEDQKQSRARALDYRGIAWEWLRRNPNYRELGPSECVETLTGLQIFKACSSEIRDRFGCLNNPSADHMLGHSSIVWSAAIDPTVLHVVASSKALCDTWSFDLERWAARATLVHAPQCEHLLISGEGQSIRLDVRSGSLLDGKVRLFFQFSQALQDGPSIDTLRRFLHLNRTGHFPSVPHRQSLRFERQLTALRVHDALQDGASIRDVGILLFGSARVRAEWPGRGEALKSQTRRLIGLARTMVSGGYKSLLYQGAGGVMSAQSLISS